MTRRDSSLRSPEERDRIERGWQCPDCYGSRVTLRQCQRYEPQGYQCEECGCNWTETAR